MNRNTKRGFLSLEAALFVPVFVIAVLTFGYLIKVAIAEENIMHIMADEARKISIHSYEVRLGPLYKDGLKSRLKGETEDVEEIYIDSFSYMYGFSDKEDLIGMRVSGNIKIKLPIVFHDSVDVTDTLLFRAFTGREFEPEIRFDDMEEEQESHPVWVFPVAGERYHEPDCGYIKVAARQTTLNSAIRKNYKPCALCGAGVLPAGSVVYYFESSGEAYHKGSCYIVDRYVISIEEEDAVKKGYTPCSKCI
jgi:hypothetical protein